LRKYVNAIKNRINTKDIEKLRRISVTFKACDFVLMQDCQYLTTGCSMQRKQLITRLTQPITYDMAIIGGGATGLGVALDAAARGLAVVLLESHDFAKGTSSRATKLVHGGVRYLAQGNVALVKEALHERVNLLSNAPHLAQPLPFVMPGYKWWETPFYGIGLKLYDLLGGKLSSTVGLGHTEFLSARQTSALLRNVQPKSLRNGVKYWDGQFDDARLAIAIAQTAADKGALLVNYCAVERFTHEGGKLVGLSARDTETQQVYDIKAKCIVNAAGVWVDQLRQLDGQATGAKVKDMVAPSQGIHLVVDREFWPTDHALLVPKTEDGRVLFAVPWLGKTVLGTTDSPRHDLAREPEPFAEQVEFVLREAGRYLQKPPQRKDVKSIWVGLRPLVKPPEEEGANTKKLSREHTILVSGSGLVTVTGGKWTTYRAMAEDVLARCVDEKLIPPSKPGVTTKLKLRGAYQLSMHGLTRISAPPGLHLYGDQASAVQQLPGADRVLGGGLTEAMVRYAVRHEYARTVEDVLARRSRLLFLDAQLASSLADAVSAILLDEIGQDGAPQAFKVLALQYSTSP
jgi:glycerol-3-phosphate dehydrogenase